MIRDLARLADREFDVLVVGGGIYGLTIAYDAAQRGLSVALVERADFGGATSFNHLKTIHGGLRYLQTADLARVRESIHERRAFATIAPRFVAPMAFVMPTSSSWTRNPLALKTALAIDAYLARDRNRGVPEPLHLPRGRVIAGTECRELCEGVVNTVASAAVWHDYVTTRGDRLTLAFAHGAAANGAILANYVEAVRVLRDHAGRVAGMNVRDIWTDQEIPVRARFLVNAAGPWAGGLLKVWGLGEEWPLLKAMNLVTSRPARTTAVVSPTRQGRAFVMLPWQGRMLIGTSESPDFRTSTDLGARRAEVEAFVAEANEAFPAYALKPSEITLVHRGIVPAASRNDRVSLLAHSRVIDHAGRGETSVVTVVGVKYTTARLTAERVVDLLFSKLSRSSPACKTATHVLPGASLGDIDAADPLVHAVRQEMAQTLTDVLIRRAGTGAAQHPGDAVAASCADMMQRELGWSDERKLAEIRALRDFYALA